MDTMTITVKCPEAAALLRRYSAAAAAFNHPSANSKIADYLEHRLDCPRCQAEQ